MDFAQKRKNIDKERKKTFRSFLWNLPRHSCILSTSPTQRMTTLKATICIMLAVEPHPHFFLRIDDEREKAWLDAQRIATNTNRVATELMSSTHTPSNNNFLFFSLFSTSSINIGSPIFSFERSYSNRISSYSTGVHYPRWIKQMNLYWNWMKRQITQCADNRSHVTCGISPNLWRIIRKQQLTIKRQQIENETSRCLTKRDRHKSSSV